MMICETCGGEAHRDEAMNRRCNGCEQKISHCVCVMPPVTLESQELIDFEEHRWNLNAGIRHIAIALDTETAQKYVELGFRVFGDKDGPYLVVRLPSSMKRPFVFDDKNVTVVFQPIRWSFGSHSGIICWLKSIS